MHLVMLKAPNSVRQDPLCGRNGAMDWADGSHWIIAWGVGGHHGASGVAIACTQRD